MVWLAGCASVFGTVRLLGVLPYLALVGAEPLHFFAFQVLAGGLEAMVLLVKAWRLMPRHDGRPVSWSTRPLRRVMHFALAMSLASVVWVLASQVDKIVLSGLLTLGDFGAFSLAIAAAAAVLLAPSALADSLVPRFTTLAASGAREDLMRLYRQSTQMGSLLAWSAAAMLACHAGTVLRVWTGDAALAQSAAPVLALYALGNAAMATSALPYTLQLAHGRLRLHLVGTGLMVVLLVPGVVYAAGRWGAPGAGTVWLLVNGLYLLAWTPVAHASFARGLHLRWLLHDVLPMAVLAAGAALATRLLPWPEDRAAGALQLVVVAAAIPLVAAAGSSRVRAWTLRRQPEIRGTAS
jgi:O-antigen/teichoic acid export membrane protein